MEDILLTTTPFYLIYDSFLSKITDDLYVELTKEDTVKDCQYLLLSAIPNFEFPRFPIFNYNLNLEYQVEEDNKLEEILDGNGEKIITIKKGGFNSILSLEEINILSELLMIEWLNRQVNSIENTRMKYSGSDFKFTSQANHLDKIMKLVEKTRLVNSRRQRLYKRRKIDENGYVSSNWSGLAGGVIKNEY